MLLVWSQLLRYSRRRTTHVTSTLKQWRAWKVPNHSCSNFSVLYLSFRSCLNSLKPHTCIPLWEKKTGRKINLYLRNSTIWKTLSIISIPISSFHWLKELQCLREKRKNKTLPLRQHSGWSWFKEEQAWTGSCVIFASAGLLNPATPNWPYLSSLEESSRTIF